jgi:hypothetical protein
MQHDNEPQPDRGSRSLLWAALIVAIVIAFIVLHLTGVFGPGSH